MIKNLAQQISRLHPGGPVEDQVVQIPVPILHPVLNWESISVSMSPIHMSICFILMYR